MVQSYLNTSDPVPPDIDGYYGSLSTTLNTLETPLPEQQKGFEKMEVL